MKIFRLTKNTGCALVMASAMASVSLQAQAVDVNAGYGTIEGVGPTINLVAEKVQITTPDGDSIQLWALKDPDGGLGKAQYPGPTIVVKQGEEVSVTLDNSDIPQPISLVFPGQENVITECSLNGSTFTAAFCDSTVPATDTLEAGVTCKPRPIQGQPVEVCKIRYKFVASNPGTYMYHSGVNPQVQLDMGLAGAMIVRPTAGGVGTAPVIPGVAYHNPGSDDKTTYDREYLFILSEMDPKLHYKAELNALDTWDNADYVSQLFFINGRNGPDTLAADGEPLLPHQPYGALTKMYPGERVLLRVLNLGRNQHPLHLHGNHFDQIARDANLLTRVGTSGTVISPVVDYTLNAIPGSTSDLVYTWTGEGMGWDIYGHTVADGITCNPDTNGWDASLKEFCADHLTPLPVVIPEDQDLAFGGFYGGSPFLGSPGNLPVGEGGLNPFGGIVFMWHSHSERELTNNDIFPGGMLTMMIVEKDNR